MKNQILEIKTALQIQKPCSEVFDAIVNPEKMTHYFISKSTGRMGKFPCLFESIFGVWHKSQERGIRLYG